MKAPGSSNTTFIEGQKTVSIKMKPKHLVPTYQEKHLPRQSSGPLPGGLQNNTALKQIDKRDIMTSDSHSAIATTVQVQELDTNKMNKTD